MSGVPSELQSISRWLAKHIEVACYLHSWRYTRDETVDLPHVIDKSHQSGDAAKQGTNVVRLRPRQVGARKVRSLQASNCQMGPSFAGMAAGSAMLNEPEGFGDRCWGSGKINFHKCRTYV